MIRGRTILRLLAATFVVVAVVGPGQRASAQTSSGIDWYDPTPAEGTTLEVRIGGSAAFSAVASGPSLSVSIHIASSALPSGATLTTVDGNPAAATFNWKPTADQIGEYVLQLTAQSSEASAVAPPRTIRIKVSSDGLGPFAISSGNISKWAYVLERATVRVAPDPRARVVTRLSTITSDNTQNIVLALDGLTTKTESWIHVRLPILPNNKLGWVRLASLSDFHAVRTHLYVDRTFLTASLQRDGKEIFRTRVGVGRPYWPTPRGEYYIRTQLLGYKDPFYGPVAFGTSARSAVLTDWPGGGYVGVHGTNAPGLIPGHVSHGCVRLRNADILRLAKVMPVGTPLTITG